MAVVLLESEAYGLRASRHPIAYLEYLVRTDSVVLLGAGVDDDVEGGFSGTDNIATCAGEVGERAEVNGSPKGGVSEGDSAPVLADMGDEDVEDQVARREGVGLVPVVIANA